MLFKNKYLKLYMVFFLVISLLFGQLSFAPKGSSLKSLVLENSGAVNVPQKLIVNGVNYAHAPRGVIVIWQGAIASIPVGWALCNGTNGTPDLRDRFIVGAGGPGYAVGATGGEAWHSLTEAEMPNHTHGCWEGGAHVHEYRDKFPIDGEGGTPPDVELENTNTSPLIQDSSLHDLSGAWSNTEYDGAHTHTIGYTGGGQAHNNLPPYYALAFIMKL